MSKSKDIISNNEKDSAVAELYSLRAGLSIISERADEIRGYEKDIKAECDKVKPIASEIYQNDCEIYKLKENIKFEESSISELQSIARPPIKSVGSRMKNIIPGYLKYIIPGAILTIIGIVLIFVAGKNLVALPMLTLLVGVPMLFISILIAFGSAHAGRDKELHETQKDIERHNDIIRERRKRIKEYYSKIADLEIVKEKLQARKKEIDVEIEKNVLPLQDKVTAVAREAYVYNSALEKEYTRLLNPADWHNADLCIFYLQTGRADSIKECLLLADR